MAQPTRPGQAFMAPNGAIGIVTEPVRKSGPNKGKLCVIYAGGSYEVSADPEPLVLVDLTATPRL